ncbi:hypothetical protein FRC00_009467 [Tulasnella sp. 408]|nr:hypothetical protein FRC00_009467 [Tulasnella sp. 408]
MRHIAYLVLLEPSPQLCVEWAISLASVLATTVALFVWGCFLDVRKSRDDFLSRIWQRRQRQAYIAKGIVPPPGIAPAGALQVQVPPAAPLPLAANPAAVQQPPPTIPPNSAAPPTSIDIEAMTGGGSDNPQHVSSDPMTSPASPPPSALPSWVQSSTIVGPLNEQVAGTPTDPNVPSASAAPPQAGVHTS